MKATIAMLPGDGIGPEVTQAVHAVLEVVASRWQHRFSCTEYLLGGCAIDACGEPLPASTLNACLHADAVFLGAVGGPKWSDPRVAVRPEQGLLKLRAGLGVYANLRPLRIHPQLRELSPLRPERLEGVDIMFVRELTGGAYFGAKTRTQDFATDECRYSVAEIERLMRRAFALARGRRGKVTSVDKANVLETSRLWRETAERVATEFPEVTLEHQLVDSMAMLLLTQPHEYDVVATENLFGDILTDEAAALAGSLGVLPSASLGDGHRGLYEPIHGSAPDIAGRGWANPLGALFSAALMLRYSLGLEDEAQALEQALDTVISRGPLTRDLGGKASTREVTDALLHILEVRQNVAR